MFPVSCLGIWWRYDIWISENLIISRTKRAFEMKQKTFFFVSRVLSFRHTKQTNKNIVDTTFNQKSSKGHFDETQRTLAEINK